MGFGGLSIKKGPPLGKWLPGGGPFFVWELEQEETEVAEKWGQGPEKTEVVTLS